MIINASSRIENSSGLPIFIGPVTEFFRRHKPHQPIDQIIDIAERPGLRTIAKDGDVIAKKCLNDEVRHDASVVRMHARTISIEYPRDFYRQTMLAPIIEEQCLRASFTLVIAGARSNRIDVAPIILRLRVNVRIAVDL